MKNYDYGKFINGVLERAPKVLIIGDTKIINPTEEHFIQAGYRKIVKTEMPVKEGYYYIGTFCTADSDSSVSVGYSYDKILRLSSGRSI